MKIPKVLLLVLAAAAAVALFTGANVGNTDRPADVDSADWIRISDTAGVSLSPQRSARQPLVGQLFVRTDSGWHAVVIRNPPSIELIHAGS